MEKSTEQIPVKEEEHQKDKYDIEKIRRAEEKRLRRQGRNLKLKDVNRKKKGDK